MTQRDESDSAPLRTQRQIMDELHAVIREHRWMLFDLGELVALEMMLASWSSPPGPDLLIAIRAELERRGLL